MSSSRRYQGVEPKPDPGEAMPRNTKQTATARRRRGS
jgi:hypothetical protein